MFKKVCKCEGTEFTIECESTDIIRLRCTNCQELDPLILHIAPKVISNGPVFRGEEIKTPPAGPSPRYEKF